MEVSLRVTAWEVFRGAGPGPAALAAGAGADGGGMQAGEAAPGAGGKRVRISSKGKVFEQKLPKRRRNIPGGGTRLGGGAAGGRTNDLLEPASNADAALGSVASAEEAAACTLRAWPLLLPQLCVHPRTMIDELTHA